LKQDLTLFIVAVQCIAGDAARMNRTLLHALGALLLSHFALATGESYPYADLDLSAKPAADSEVDPRFFFIFTNASTGSFVTFNTTLLLFSAGILLWGIAGAVALYYLLTAPADEGSGYSSYGSGSGGGGYSGSSRGRKGSFDPYSIDWEKFSILDWISIGQETWEKFDPADADCQLRLICEVHQNTGKFGHAAQKMVDVFSYLQFIEVLSLPDEIKALVEEWLNAADRGRNGQKDCGEIFQTCDYSVNKIVDKFSHNEI